MPVNKYSLIKHTHLFSELLVGSPLTGAQTATFTATNKPGAGTAGPVAWAPVTISPGVVGYIPIFGA